MSVPGVLILSRCLNFRLMQSKTISRVMSCVIIYPMELSPVPLSDPPENMTGSHIRFLFGLASDGVYMAFSVTRETVVSYTAFPPLPDEPAVYFCCTVSGVASARRYLALCPVKPGLSSPAAFRFCGSDHLSYSMFLILSLFPCTVKFRP